jgi:transposase IS116/IS110/IS902 family protein
MAQVRSWAVWMCARARWSRSTARAGSWSQRGLPGDTRAVVEFWAGLPGPTRAAYEAGPTGFTLACAARRGRRVRGGGDTAARLRCLRRIDTLSAVGLCAEVGNFERFARAGQLMSYLGLVPREDSSGELRRQGAITETGSRHARRLLIEAAWHYRRRPATGHTVTRRQSGWE